MLCLWRHFILVSMSRTLLIHLPYATLVFPCTSGHSHTWCEQHRSFGVGYWPCWSVGLIKSVWLPLIIVLEEWRSLRNWVFMVRRCSKTAKVADGGGRRVKRISWIRKHLSLNKACTSHARNSPEHIWACSTPIKSDQLTFVFSYYEKVLQTPISTIVLI
jgi:hypothetical protein